MLPSCQFTALGVTGHMLTQMPHFTQRDAMISGRAVIARAAPRRPIERLPFAVWMALARATPLLPPDDGQGDLANVA